MLDLSSNKSHSHVKMHNRNGKKKTLAWRGPWLWPLRGVARSGAATMCPCARSSSSHSPGSAPAAAWRAGDRTPA